MKTIKLVGELLNYVIGRDNNRFYAILLFLALMFTLWVLRQVVTNQQPNAANRPKIELSSGFK